MNPNSSTPSQTPSDGPMPSMGATPQPQLPSMPNTPKKSKLPLYVAIVVIVLLAGGAAAYMFMKKDTKQPATNNTANVQTKTQQTTKTNDESATTTTSFTNTDGKSTVSVTHPKDWMVDNSPDQYGSKQLSVKSPRGNYIHFADNLGVGGRCDPDTYSYTLVKKVSTQDSRYVFSEYTTTNPQQPRIKFSLEPIAGAPAAVKALKDGESGTDVCSNLFYYPIVGAKQDIFVKIDTSAKMDDTTAVPYDTLKTDTDFIAMLQSLTVKDSD